MTEKTSLASLFAKVKTDLKRHGTSRTTSYTTPRKMQGTSRKGFIDTPVVNEGDEWALGIKDVTDKVFDAIEWFPRSRVVLGQKWICECGHHGQNHLGQFMEETSRRGARRLRQVGRAFSYTELDFPLRSDWLDPQLVSHCMTCADESWMDEAYQHKLFEAEPPTTMLIELCETVVSDLTIVPPGYNKNQTKIIHPLITRSENERASLLDRQDAEKSLQQIERLNRMVKQEEAQFGEEC